MLRQLLQGEGEDSSQEEIVVGLQDVGGLESIEALAVFTQIVLLGATIIIGHTLDKYNISWMSTAGVALLIGIVVGCLVKYSKSDETYAKSVDFSTEFFFIVLLPPIIFEAGFSLAVTPFFRNIGAICVFAFVGTTVSAFAIGLTMFVTGYMDWVYKMDFLEALIFGAIISATDPVTVLAVFSKLGAQEDLYALVFGESVLNDAVAIVLYGTLTPFISQQFTGLSLLAAFGTFLVTFLGSMMIGVVTAIVFALLLRNKFFRSEHHPLESCLVALGAYMSYYIAEGCHFGSLKLSGIVSILFCGIVMAKYTKPNMSQTETHKVESLFKIVATLSETFVFIYIGVSLFLNRQAWSTGLTWGFIFIALIALAWSRAVNVYMNSAFVNVFRPPSLHISGKAKFMMWFAGLRGAIAFALALESSEDLKFETAQVIQTTTFFIVLVTVLVNGGASTWMLKKLQLLQTYQEIGDGQMQQELGRLQFNSSEESGLATLPSSPLHKVRKFNALGGISKAFAPLDKRLSSVLIRPPTKNENEMEMLGFDSDTQENGLEVDLELHNDNINDDSSTLEFQSAQQPRKSSTIEETQQ
eukprot:TRINITY_DN650_c0_g1_i1.p1 TRINITY_DN650_c0_g1~~TRINITY_DN650_c0_g1_i1.p1  ORF type:complete len:584 (-),score=92.71 TRINITY_DN650_c0_g1_i1:328-2079(-)